jgi:hypothetical protein
LVSLQRYRAAAIYIGAAKLEKESKRFGGFGGFGEPPLSSSGKWPRRWKPGDIGKEIKRFGGFGGRHCHPR